MNSKKQTDFGQRMKEMRAIKGLSQLQMAAKTGMPQPLISRYERPFSNPTYSTVCEIADKLGFTVEFVPKKEEE